MKTTWYKGLVGAILVCSLGACASTPAAHSVRASVAQARSVPAGCVAETGTRVAPKRTHCTGFGHLWTADDLRRTGAIDPAQALSMLDPSVSIH
ncbi:MAG: hypothetical protein ACREUT_21440 [Steroidobacteraceae bacterium]